jgi:hypothetical protein
MTGQVVLDFRPADTLTVSGAGGESHTFYSPEMLVRFLRAQRSGTSWTIQHRRNGTDISTPMLFPLSVLDQFRGMF